MTTKRPSKAAAAKAAALKEPVAVTRDPNAPPPKMALARTAYNAFDKKAIERNNAPNEATDKQAATKNKQAAAQES